MTILRSLWLLGLAATLAACSGNLGGGQSTLPGMPQGGTNVAPVAAPAPSPSPVSASNVATIGDSTAAQALPSIDGWAGTIAFAKPSAAPSLSASIPVATAVSIGITASLVRPSDAPPLGAAQSKRHAGGKSADSSPKGVFFISLLATSDVALSEYPKIAIDIPRTAMSIYRDDTYGLALYDPETKGKSYALAVAERDLASPPPATVASSTPLPALPTPSALPAVPGSFTPPPMGTGLDAATLPPEHIAFNATAVRLTLKANRPVVFALYVMAPTPSPSPSSSATALPTTAAPTTTAVPKPVPSVTPPSPMAPAATP